MCRRFAYTVAEGSDVCGPNSTKRAFLQRDQRKHFSIISFTGNQFGCASLETTYQVHLSWRSALQSGALGAEYGNSIIKNLVESLRSLQYLYSLLGISSPF
jgi:hypothetical protein